MSFLTKSFVALGVTIVLFAGGYIAGQILYTSKTPVVAQSFGSFTPVGGQTYTLSGSGVVASATTIPLTSFTTPDGRALTMAYFGTIGYAVLDPNSPSRIEDITFTGITQNANGSAILTGVSRGMDFVSPYTASTTLSQAHAGGSYLILSNSAGFYGQQFAFVNNTSSITGVWTFASTSPPQYDGNTTASGNQFVSFNQLAATAIQGAATTSFTNMGISQLANAAQVGAGTASSTTQQPLVISNKFATTTPGVQCTGGVWSCVVVANTAGKISQLWLDLTQAFTFSTTTQYFANVGTLTATTSARLPLSTNFGTVAYTFPSTQGVAGSSLQNNGSGALSWSAGSPHYSLITDTDVNASGSSAQTATSSAMVIPANTLNASSTIVVQGNISTCQNNNTSQVICTFTLYNQTTYTQIATCSITSTSSGGPVSGSFLFTIANQSSVSSQSSLTNCSAASSAGGTYQNTGLVGGSSVNTASALSLVMVVTTSAVAGTNTGTINNFSIVVNP